MKFTKINRNHAYAVIYKDKCVKNYSWREPLNKEGWVLGDIEKDNKYNICPLEGNYLKMLLNDNDVTIIDLGPWDDLNKVNLDNCYYLLKNYKEIYKQPY